jgi:spore coat protein CotH
MRRALAFLAVLTLALAAPSRTAAQTTADLFDATALHDVSLRINSRDWQDLHERFGENTFYPCDVEWRGVRVANAGCRSRGGGSRNGIKPGLLIDFDRYVTGQRFLGLRALVLDNLWQDPSMIREYLSMWLFARVGVPAPRVAYARLFVGASGEFAGLYALVEEVDSVFLAQRGGAGNEYVYEYKWVQPYYFEDLGPDLAPYAVRFEPKTHETASTFELFAPVQALVRAVNEAPADDLEASVGGVLDLDTWTTHLAIENFLSEWDGLLGYAGMNNVFLYRSPASPRFTMVPWDKDNTFTAVETHPWHGFADNVLARKIQASAPRARRYLAVLLAAAAEGPALEAEAARIAAQIAASAHADPVKPVSSEAFEQAVAAVQAFARRRPGVVRDYVREIDPGVTGRAPTRYRPALPRR